MDAHFAAGLCKAAELPRGWGLELGPHLRIRALDEKQVRVPAPANRYDEIRTQNML